MVIKHGSLVVRCGKFFDIFSLINFSTFCTDLYKINYCHLIVGVSVFISSAGCIITRSTVSPIFKMFRNMHKIGWCTDSVWLGGILRTRPTESDHYGGREVKDWLTVSFSLGKCIYPGLELASCATENRASDWLTPRIEHHPTLHRKFYPHPLHWNWTKVALRRCTASRALASEWSSPGGGIRK